MLARSMSPEELARVTWPQQPWVSPGLLPAQLSMDEIDRLLFFHLTTCCVPVEPGLAHKAFGTTVWVAATEDKRAVMLSFDWAAIDPGVLVVADVLRVTSNLWPLDEAGAPLEDRGRALALMRLVWQTQWQETVMEHLPTQVLKQLKSPVRDDTDAGA